MTDPSLALHMADARSLHEFGLLRPVNPLHRDKADLIARWREAALRPEPAARPSTLFAMIWRKK